MMRYSDSMHGVSFGFHLHMLFGAILFVGIILFLMWAYKNLSKDALKKWAIWMVVVGGIGTILTGALGMRGWHGMMDYEEDDDEIHELLDK